MVGSHYTDVRKIRSFFQAAILTVSPSLPSCTSAVVTPLAGYIVLVLARVDCRGTVIQFPGGKEDLWGPPGLLYRVWGLGWGWGGTYRGDKVAGAC